MASEAHLHAWEQRLRDWEAEQEARERKLQEREAILQDDGTTLQDALSSLEEAEAAGDGEHLETTLQDALSSLEEAEAAGGGEALGEARTLLLEGTCARSAALALMTIADVANNCDNDDALLAIKATERAVRDAFVVRCRSQAVPGDRISFLNVAWKAFGQPPDPDWKLRIPVLLGSYHKTAKGKANTFPSKNQLANKRRGGPRPRKRQARDVNEVVPARIGAIIIRTRMIIMTIMVIKIMIIIRQRGDAWGLLEPGHLRPRRNSGARGRAVWRRERRAHVESGAQLGPPRRSARPHTTREDPRQRARAQLLLGVVEGAQARLLRRRRCWRAQA
jgi:hypothetical protein